MTYFDIKDAAIEFGIVKTPLEFENMNEKQRKRLKKVLKKYFNYEYVD